MQDFTKLTTPALLRRARLVALRDPTAQCQERWDCIYALANRPERPVFETCARWSRDRLPLVRWLGVDVLGRLRDERPVFVDESLPLLAERLHDTDIRIIEAALYSFGHLNAGDLPTLCAFVRDRSSDIRYALAFAIGKRDEPLALETLARLSRDRNGAVRDWATFSLGRICETDTPTIRETLAARLHDKNDDVRFEAVVGLGVRGDLRAWATLLECLQQAAVPNWAYNAIAELPDAVYLPYLRTRIAQEPDDWNLREALAKCEEVAQA